jgi:hypothetical protein
MFRHLWSAIIRESLHRLKLGPSDRSVLWGTVTSWRSHSPGYTSGTNSKDNSDRYKNSLMMALQKCRNVKEIVRLLCSHFSACNVVLINWTLHYARFVQHQYIIYNILQICIPEQWSTFINTTAGIQCNLIYNMCISYHAGSCSGNTLHFYSGRAGSNLDFGASHSEAFSGSWYVQANAGLVPPLCHYSFLSNPFQPFIH